jgi:hypothetical protein
MVRKGLSYAPPLGKQSEVGSVMKIGKYLFHGTPSLGQGISSEHPPPANS